MKPVVVTWCLLLTGCSREHYVESADQEVYAAINQKAPRVQNMDPNFSLDQAEAVDLNAYPVIDQNTAFFGEYSELELGHHVVSLEQALDIGVQHNRQYQNSKESLYLEALGLTLSRHRYTPIFSGGVNLDYDETRSTEQVAAGIDKLVTEHDTQISGRVGADQLLRAGGRLATSFTTDFFRYLAGDGRVATSSALVTTLSQPLLRGAGYKVAMENLTQAERNLLYSLRDFTRFRQEFTVSIVTEYYRVLQDRDRVRNAWQAYQNFQDNVRRETARYEEGEARKADLAELQESELTNEQAWIDAFRNYRENLDRFKVTLGLTTDTPIMLDDSELQRLAIDETHLALSLDEAVEVALTARLDLQTVHDQVADAERKVDVVANGLLPDMDLVASARVNGRDGAKSPSLDFDEYSWSAGLAVDLPLDRKSERNAFRAALIQAERARRAQENLTDEVRLDIQNGWRNLEQAKRNFEISEVRVSLSRSRHREQIIRREIGEGDAFDLVRAQDALTGSQNQLTSALIDHTIRRLSFWRDLGLLHITDNGNWTLELASRHEIQ